jgi:hypothetical protein
MHKLGLEVPQVSLSKQLLRGASVALAAMLILPALAFGDAADVTSATGSVTNVDPNTGAITVEVHGTWAWTTHNSDCNNDKRAVGVAIDWHDPNAAGNHVTTLNAVSIDVGTPGDNVVHPAEPGADTATVASWRGGCGVFDAGKGYNSGTWASQTHTYAAGPLPQICALTYDVHLTSNGGAPNGVKEITAGGNNHNGDNSAEKNGSTPAGNTCAAITVAPPPTKTGTGPGRNPAIHIEKTGPASAQAGSTVAYLLLVTNPGNQSFPEAGVTVTDPLCAAAPTLIMPGGKPGDATPGTFDPGDAWYYMCSVATAAGQASIHNVGVVTGKDFAGDVVTDDDPADTQLVQPEQPQQGVLPLLPGSARLRGPAGCLSGGSHTLAVTGKRIAKVTFYLDGKKVAVRRKADSHGRFTYKVNRSSLRLGAHTVVAKVNYKPETVPGTKTFRRTFARCAQAIQPKFTG